MDLNKILRQHPLTIIMSIFGGLVGNWPGAILLGFIGMTLDAVLGKH